MPALGERTGKLVTIPGIVPAADAMPSGCRFASRCPFAVDRCAQNPPSRQIGDRHQVACWRAPLETLVALDSGMFAEATE